MTTKRPHSPPDSPPSQASRVRVSEAPKLTLTSVSDDLDPQTHIGMDKSVITTFGDEYDPSNPTQVALLLSVIAVTSDNILDQKYSDIKAGLQLLRELPELEAELKTAWKARSFRSIRCLQILRPSNVKSESSEQMSPPPDPHVVAQGRATELSWTREFNGDAHKHLWDFIAHYFRATEGNEYYAHYATIMQSSGMGKSRVVDQIGKTHFVIPMNLRLGARGYPPADEQVVGYLSQTQDQFQTFLRTCGFLSALFIETRLVIMNDSKAIKRPSHLPAIDPNCEYEELAAQFHDYMTDGMTISSHGPFRKMFYQAVVDRAVQESTPACYDFFRKHGTDLNADQSHAIVSPSRTDVNKFPRNDALEQLIKAVQSFSAPPCSPTIQRSSTAREKVEEDPLVMLTFDDAHALTLGGPNRVWSNFTELRRSLRGVNKLRIFSVFLSTTGTIIQFTPPKDLDRSSLRIVLGEFALIEPYCDLGFDQLAAKLTFSGGGVRKIDEFTNNKCISHFGRPLFGSRYDYGEDEVKSTIVEFAAAKLLGGHEYTGATNLTNSQKLACLSQRLPIEFISTTYAHHAEEMEQVEGHMRVCLRVSPGFESMMTVSPSEPLLSEAAYWVMQNKHFDPPRTLQTVLEGFSIHKGDRGELLVMLLLTLARDAAVGPPADRGKPVQRWTTVPDFFSNLFSARMEGPLQPTQPPASAQDELPTAPGHVVGPGGVGTSKITFEERFRDARVYFSHTIKVHQQSFLTTPRLAALFYRGAAVLCGNNQPAIDGIIPICMGEELKPEHMGAILWQSKNDPAYTSNPKASLFDSMDPFSLNIFRDNDTHTTSARAPLIRIVFALAAKKPSLKLVKVSESAGTAFTTYDIWCAGLSPHILAPIDSGQTDVWKSLLEATYGWREIYKSDPKNFGQMDLRRNSNPGAAEDAGHWSWFTDA